VYSSELPKNQQDLVQARRTVMMPYQGSIDGMVGDLSILEQHMRLELNAFSDHTAMLGILLGYSLIAMRVEFPFFTMVSSMANTSLMISVAHLRTCPHLDLMLTGVAVEEQDKVLQVVSIAVQVVGILPKERSDREHFGLSLASVIKVTGSRYPQNGTLRTELMA
jgi:hypothetical protein